MADETTVDGIGKKPASLEEVDGFMVSHTGEGAIAHAREGQGREDYAAALARYRARGSVKSPDAQEPVNADRDVETE